MIATTGATVVVSIQYQWILSAAVLEAVQGRAFNIHNARLPEYRGHNSLSHEILNGETKHTVTIHWMATNVDRGYRCLEQSISIRAEDTAKSLHSRSVQLAAELFEEFLQKFDDLVHAQKVPIEGLGNWYGKNSLLPIKRICPNTSMDRVTTIARALFFPPHLPPYVEMASGFRFFVIPEVNDDGSLVDQNSA
jgi:methionyl-tRNA formyltransferase